MLETKETLFEKYVLLDLKLRKKKKILWFILVVCRSLTFEVHLHHAIFTLSHNCILGRICQISIICKEGLASLINLSLLVVLWYFLSIASDTIICKYIWICTQLHTHGLQVNFITCSVSVIIIFKKSYVLYQKKNNVINNYIILFKNFVFVYMHLI